MNKNKLIESIKEHEGFSFVVYDCPSGKKTIGYGRNLESTGITYDEAEFLLENDLKRIQKELKSNLYFYHHITYEKLPEHVQNVLMEMAYQIGVKGLMKFKKTLMYVRYENYEKASKEMLNSLWAKQTPNRAKKLSQIMKGGY